MRVLLDTTFALRGHSGTGVYLAHLEEALSDLGIDVVEASNDGRRAPGGGLQTSAFNAAADQWWSTVELPRRARHAGADVVHHPLPAHSPMGGIAQVVTVHDLAFERVPEGFDARFRTFARIAHRRAARSAGAIVAVSRTTAQDVMARWGIARERIVVARHGPGQEPDATRPRERESTHLLYVGDDEPRKNLGLLLAAYRLYREDTVHAGAEPLPLVLAGTARAEAEGVVVVDRPEPEALTKLYAGAAALVHPSLHEGFGLTPLEAMSAGVPVVAACSPGVVEVCGDATILVDPRDAPALAATLRRVVEDDHLRRDLTERGRRRAAEFSWARSARAHVEAYTLALHGDKGHG
jgi:glycosyltransferase involved in cell wall biosynthesis